MQVGIVEVFMSAKPCYTQAEPQKHLGWACLAGDVSAEKPLGPRIWTGCKEWLFLSEDALAVTQVAQRGCQLHLWRFSSPHQIKP